MILPQPRRALIVAHGQPSEPGPAEADLRALAQQVAACLPAGWQVGAATLAAPGALEAAVAAPGGGVIFPMFMAKGWFTRRQLPDRLAQAGATDWQVLEPFGTDPGVQALTVTLVREAMARLGTPAAAQAMVLAAHGSSRSEAPAAVAQAMARRIALDTGIGQLRVGFIEQAPRIAEAARDLPPGAFCLPFFAARGGHVTGDLPVALAEVGFDGPLLDPVGCDARVPGCIAQALLRAAG